MAEAGIEKQSSFESLKSVLNKPWRKLVVEAGSARKLSVPPINEDSLTLLVDPTFKDPIDWGRNQRGKGLALGIQAKLGELEFLEGKVDTVLVTAPHPDQAVEIVSSAMSMIKPDGKIVIAFDRTSNKAHLVDDVVKDIRMDAKNFGFVVEKPEENVNSLIHGRLNSDVIVSSPRVYVLRKTEER